MRSHRALEQPELHGDVPLHRDAVVREVRQRAVEVGEQRAPRTPAATAAMSSGTIVPAIEASGVGYCIWKRTPAGIVPSCWSRSKIAKDSAYASA